MGSPRFALNQYDWQNIVMQAAVCAAGAVAAYLSTIVIPGLQQGSIMDMALAAGATVLVHVLQRFVTDNRSPGQNPSAAEQK